LKGDCSKQVEAETFLASEASPPHAVVVALGEKSLAWNRGGQIWRGHTLFFAWN